MSYKMKYVNTLLISRSIPISLIVVTVDTSIASSSSVVIVECGLHVVSRIEGLVRVGGIVIV